MKNEMNAKQLDLNEMDMVSGGADGQQSSGKSGDYSGLMTDVYFKYIEFEPVEQPRL